MNGPHDLGGMSGFGKLGREENEPLFHADWEKRALAITVGSGFCGQWNIDISRHARESLPTEFYRSSSYYEIWTAALTRLLLDRGMITSGELIAGEVEAPAVPVKRVVSGDEMPSALLAGAPVDRKSNQDPLFKPGDVVRTKHSIPIGHTRLPSYARNKTGFIQGVHGCHVFPDSNAAGKGEDPHWLYNVAFDGKELFGETAENQEVMIDCWEPYLVSCMDRQDA